VGKGAKFFQDRRQLSLLLSHLAAAHETREGGVPHVTMGHRRSSGVTQEDCAQCHLSKTISHSVFGRALGMSEMAKEQLGSSCRRVGRVHDEMQSIYPFVSIRTLRFPLTAGRGYSTFVLAIR